MHIRRASYISGGVARVEQKIRVARNRIFKKPNESRSKIFILFKSRNTPAQQDCQYRIYGFDEFLCEARGGDERESAPGKSDAPQHHQTAPDQVRLGERGR